MYHLENYNIRFTGVIGETNWRYDNGRIDTRSRTNVKEKSWEQKRMTELMHWSRRHLISLLLNPHTCGFVNRKVETLGKEW